MDTLILQITKLYKKNIVYIKEVFVGMLICKKNVNVNRALSFAFRYRQNTIFYFIFILYVVQEVKLCYKNALIILFGFLLLLFSI